MTWLAWRQLRTQALVAAALLTAFVITLSLSGPNLLHYADTVVKTCRTHHDCVAATANFRALAHLANAYSLLVVLVPVLLGVFWGAPLVARELEAGTFRLAWTQSVTRRRWIATRLCMVTVVAVTLTVLLSVAVTWWQSPVDRLNQALFDRFDQRDLVPAAYAAFAVTLGTLVGALVRRTLAAMAATLAGFAVVRYVDQQFVRPNLIAPMQLSRPYRAPTFLGPNTLGYTITPPNPNAWMLSDQVVTRTGQVIGEYGGIGANGSFGISLTNNGAAVFTGVGRCPNRIPVPPGGIRSHMRPSESHLVQAAIQRCVNSFHLREVLTFQPTTHYWPLQWSEAAIFLAAAALLGAACVWLVRRNLP
jgi:hypothetical protein